MHQKLAHAGARFPWPGVIRARLMAADHLERRATAKHSRSDQLAFVDVIAHGQRFKAPTAAVADGGDAAAHHLFSVNRAIQRQFRVARREEVGHMSRSANHRAVRVTIDYARQKEFARSIHFVIALCFFGQLADDRNPFAVHKNVLRQKLSLLPYVGIANQGFHMRSLLFFSAPVKLHVYAYRRHLEGGRVSPRPPCFS